MTINPLTLSKTTIKPNSVQLNAMKPAELAKFYQEIIGLELIAADTTAQVYQLGNAKKEVLVEIYPADQAKSGRTTGLYHLALLLPQRSDLGEILTHFIEQKVALEGAADHGYSEAIYLPDPEGNGIEIYCDKNTDTWDIDASGRINGVVEAMDYQAVLAAAKKAYTTIPAETRMGHIHLHVDDLESTQNFYHEILGLGLKNQMHKAIFMATEDYHHDLGANLWNGPHIPAAPNGSQGLRRAVWRASQTDLRQIKARLDQHNHAYNEGNDGQLDLLDAAGINLRILPQA